MPDPIKPTTRLEFFLARKYHTCLKHYKLEKKVTEQEAFKNCKYWIDVIDKIKNIHI